MYREGRIKVLQNFLGRERIYLRDVFRGSGMEEKARANITREIMILSIKELNDV
jgi:predicted metal-dependent HD superfamily phosphohydrolase